MADKVTNYINQLNQNIMDSFESAEWGNPIEAQIGGSNSQFRKSDDIRYISDILAQGPNSYIEQYTEELNAIRGKYGLPTLKLSEETQAGTPIVDPVAVEPGATAEPVSSWYDPLGLSAFVRSYAISGGFWTIGLILLFGGIFLLAYQSETVRSGAKAAVKVVA